MSTYFTPPATVLDGTTAKAADVNDLNTATTAGFDAVESAVGGIPPIASGDAYKVLQVNAGETAREAVSELRVDIAAADGTQVLNNGTDGTDATFTGNAATATVATTITTVDESTDTTCYIAYFNTPTGDQAIKTGTNITFNSSSGILSTGGLITIGDITSGGKISSDGDGSATLIDNRLENHADDSDTANISISFNGYAEGTTRYRNFAVYDGKQSPILELNGSTKKALLFGQIESIVTTGTAPLVIASTTKVDNLNVATVNGADYETTTKAADSNFTSGTFRYTRIGNLVTVSFDSLGHAGSSGPSTSVGFLPTSYRPSVDAPTAYYSGAGGNRIIRVDTDGHIAMLYSDTDGVAEVRTSSGEGTISYSI